MDVSDLNSPAADRAVAEREPVSLPPRELVIGLAGVGAGSPLGKALVLGLRGTALVESVGPAVRASRFWQSAVRGTVLDWIASEAGAPAPSQPDLLLDLHGIAPAGEVPVWRVVDAYGNCVLQPFSCLADPPDPNLAACLYLLEASGAGAADAILAEACISGRRSIRDLLETLGKTVVWLVRRALQARNTDSYPQSGAVRRFQHPSIANVVRWQVRAALAAMRDHIGSEIWAIGNTAEPVENFLRSRTVDPESWFEVPSREGFVADPFPWPGRDGTILYERYSHRTGLGSIEALLPDKRTEPLPLPLRCHLSYPCAFIEDSKVLCLPEMSAEHRQVIYCLDAHGPPREVCVVAENVAMADATLFRHDGLYWIAYNDADLGLHENLCLRYAERLEGPWRAHPLNPVKLDVRSSRPGGALFRLDDSLFRPAQDCSRSYGCALVINRVIECSPRSYAEQPVARLTPDPQSRYPDGLHTFSLASGGILLDGKRVAYDPVILVQRIARRLRRVTRKPASDRGLQARQV